MILPSDAGDPALDELADRELRSALYWFRVGHPAYREAGDVETAAALAMADPMIQAACNQGRAFPGWADYILRSRNDAEYRAKMARLAEEKYGRRFA